MGLHTGTAHERDGDYFGTVVNRAARIGAAGHGGQVLVSAATAELLVEEDWSLIDLDEHHLKGLKRAEHLLQLRAEGMPDVELAAREHTRLIEASFRKTHNRLIGNAHPRAGCACRSRRPPRRSRHHTRVRG